MEVLWNHYVVLTVAIVAMVKAIIVKDVKIQMGVHLVSNALSPNIY